MNKIKKMNGDEELEIDHVTGVILRASFEVMNELGHGFQEVLYQRALSLELTEAGLVVEREAQFPVRVSQINAGLLINFGRSKLEWRRLNR